MAEKSSQRPMTATGVSQVTGLSPNDANVVAALLPAFAGAITEITQTALEKTGAVGDMVDSIQDATNTLVGSAHQIQLPRARTEKENRVGKDLVGTIPLPGDAAAKTGSTPSKNTQKARDTSQHQEGGGPANPEA